MSSQERDLIDAVIEDPGDDLRRLVYADWCEENGRDARAELVRVQVELAGLTWVVMRSSADARRTALRERESALLDRLRREMPVLDRRRSEMDVTMKRGFIYSVKCPLAAWLARGPDVAAEHPLEGGVDITEMRGAGIVTRTLPGNSVRIGAVSINAQTAFFEVDYRPKSQVFHSPVMYSEVDSFAPGHKPSDYWANVLEALRREFHRVRFEPPRVIGGIDHVGEAVKRKFGAALIFWARDEARRREAAPDDCSRHEVRWF